MHYTLTIIINTIYVFMLLLAILYFESYLYSQFFFSLSAWNGKWWCNWSISRTNRWHDINRTLWGAIHVALFEHNFVSLVWSSRHFIILYVIIVWSYSKDIHIFVFRTCYYSSQHFLKKSIFTLPRNVKL